MIILPIDEDSAPSSLHFPAFKPAPLERTVRLLVFGFTPAERELIQGIRAVAAPLGAPAACGR